MTRLDSEHFTGLTRFLSPDKTTIAFGTIQKTYVALDAEIRALSNPVSADAYPVAGGIEDHASNGPYVVERVGRIVDNLYYIGSQANSSWAVTTSEGIIVIDAGFHYSIEELAADGLRQLGLDPADIRYVIVSHAHSDHYMGARYLQDTYGARVILSDADWNVIENDFYPGAVKPTRDMVATDGMELTLGDTTLTLYVTPGHTPGTISTLIPLNDGDETHLGSIWGGMTFGFERAGVRYFPDLLTALGTNSSEARRYRV